MLVIFCVKLAVDEVLPLVFFIHSVSALVFESWTEEKYFVRFFSLGISVRFAFYFSFCFVFGFVIVDVFFLRDKLFILKFNFEVFVRFRRLERLSRSVWFLGDIYLAAKEDKQLRERNENEYGTSICKNIEILVKVFFLPDRHKVVTEFCKIFAQ